MSSTAVSPREADSPALARQRIVLLGASNLTMGIGTVIRAAEATWAGPLEVAAAMGHGRSYGITTSVLSRTLPGIVPCELWRQVSRWEGGSIAALLTDIGNDLLYEQSVDSILGWVEQCLERLAQLRARIVVTALPLDNLHSLSPAKFHLFRSILFRRSRLKFEDCRLRVSELNQGLRRLVAARGVTLATQQASWYGFDPMHIRRAQRATAWREILSHWQAPAASAAGRAPLGRSLYLQTRVPHFRRVMGFEQRRAQPAARLSGGTTVAIY